MVERHYPYPILIQTPRVITGTKTVDFTPGESMRTLLDQRVDSILRQLLNSGQSEAILVAEFLADLSNIDDTADLDLLRTSAQEIIDSAQAFLDATKSRT